jgi:hypothetical protein
MRKGIFICLMMGMFLFSFASAGTTSLGKISQGQCIQIPQVCASCTYVNLSVQYPNKSIAISNQAMIPNGAGLWTYEFCDTNQLGRYDVSGQGDINAIDTGFSVLVFQVEGGNLTIFLVLVGASLILLLFAFLFKSPWISFASGSLMIVSGIYLMVYGLQSFSDLYTRSIAYTSIGIGLFFAIASGFDALSEW